MQIRVTKVEQRGGGCCIAHFQSDYGDAVGKWSGTPPTAGAGYTVDVEIAECLTVGQSLLTLPAGPARLAATPSNTILIQGIIENAWPEGVLSIRIGQSLIDIEADRLVAPGKWVMAECHEIRLYDVNL